MPAAAAEGRYPPISLYSSAPAGTRTRRGTPASLKRQRANCYWALATSGYGLVDGSMSTTAPGGLPGATLPLRSTNGVVLCSTSRPGGL